MFYNGFKTFTTKTDQSMKQFVGKGRIFSETFKLCLLDFKDSVGWFNKFRQRYGTIFIHVCGEGGSVNNEAFYLWISVIRKYILTTHNDFSTLVELTYF